jgi:predicted kinase
MKQTAVEWLVQQTSDMKIDKTHYIISEWEDGYNVALEGVLKLLSQALEMEKQQIIDAANLPIEKRWFDATLYKSCGEQYYNETYKNEQI